MNNPVSPPNTLPKSHLPSFKLLYAAMNIFADSNEMFNYKRYNYLKNGRTGKYHRLCVQPPEVKCPSHLSQYKSDDCKSWHLTHTHVEASWNTNQHSLSYFLFLEKKENTESVSESEQLMSQGQYLRVWWIQPKRTTIWRGEGKRRKTCVKKEFHGHQIIPAS